jgi:hypothetical protein
MLGQDVCDKGSKIMPKIYGLQALLSSILIGGLLIISPGCIKASPVQVVPTTTQDEGSTYKILNPQGVPLPVTVHPLAPRLDSLNNKTVYVVFYEPKEIITQALLAKLKSEYPKTTWKSVTGKDFGSYIPEDEVVANAQAVIRGNAW